MDELLKHPVALVLFIFGGIVFMIYGLGFAIMLALSWMGDRPLRPIIAYSLTTAAAVAYAFPSRQWLIMAVLVLIGAGCTALHLFAVIGRQIPDAELSPDEFDTDELDEDEGDEDDDTSDSR